MENYDTAQQLKQPQSTGLQDLAIELETELRRILQFWADTGLDKLQGGFVGRIDQHNQVIPESEKGLILNSRILWSFATAAGFYPDPQYRQLASRAYHYIRDHFIDREYGGAYWSLEATGQVKDSKKQTYAIAFCIYGLSAYIKLTGDAEALQLVLQLYLSLQSLAKDKINGGYLEAFDRQWQPLEDLRLSEKDLQADKTANTHLHLVEAFAELYQVWPDPQLAENIKELLNLFQSRIIDPENARLHLFFTRDWKSLSEKCSPGHDIEAAWLLQQIAERVADSKLQQIFRDLAGEMSQAALSSIDTDGALIYESDAATGLENREKHWWVQAEAMVGFFNAHQLTGSTDYLKRVREVWAFIDRYLLDKQGGEWHWGVDGSHRPLAEPKAGFWKCPYHNSRACMELIHRITASTL